MHWKLFYKHRNEVGSVNVRILFLFSHPWRFGGAETYTRALIKGLAGRGHEITLITDSGSEPDIPEGVSVEFSSSKRKRKKTTE